MTLNRLQFETSPYLKQHEKNPVDWYPWGKEALDRARTEDKPIVLSVGYSACHWCHVMAHESFENPQIARIMNEHFINIKVDREERPDLDQVYQPVAQILTRGGGWPLTVFLTPDLKPFYGGTYFPPTDRYGRPGFGRVLLALAQGYRDDRGSISERAERLTQAIREHEEWSPQSETSVPEADTDTHTDEALLSAARDLVQKVDWQNGGFGGAPKFPNVSGLSFLWRMGLCSSVPPEDRSTFREAVILSLDRMRCGGIFDQLGGGFSRYSVDDHWAVPHFEKMLYDNAQLMKLFGEVLAGEFSKELSPPQKERFLSGLSLTLDYLKREMVSPSGAFYAAQDADSDGEEGKFFVWTREELQAILEPPEFEAFCRFFGVTEAGNFEAGQNVFYLAHPDEVLDDALSNSVLESAVQKVRAAREKRVRPGLDDKVLISWNGLMISGLAWASLAFESTRAEETRALAVRAFDALMDASVISDPRRFLEDYAFMAQAALDLARVDPSRAAFYVEYAAAAMKEVHARFTDEHGLGFFMTANDDEALISRPKSLYDQAIPSGSGVVYGVIQVLMQVLDCEIENKWTRDSATLIGVAKDHSFGMSEILSSILLSRVSPIILKGAAELRFRAHPFCFVVDGTTSPVQYCHRQTCMTGEFQDSEIFRELFLK